MPFSEYADPEITQEDYRNYDEDEMERENQIRAVQRAIENLDILNLMVHRDEVIDDNTLMLEAIEALEVAFQDELGM